MGKQVRDLNVKLNHKSTKSKRRVKNCFLNITKAEIIMKKDHCIYKIRKYFSFSVKQRKEEPGMGL